MSDGLASLVEHFLAAHLELHPVDASFMGIPGHDHRLPPAGRGVEDGEAATWEGLEREAAALPEPGTPTERIELAMLLAQVRLARRELAERPRFANPAWYTGEAAFAVVALLLPDGGPRERDDLRQRLEAIPAFLQAGMQRLSGTVVPADWAERARRECSALAVLLERGLRRHDLWSDALEASANAAARAAGGFAAALDGLPDAPYACGAAYLDFLVREVHRFPYGAREAESLAREGFERARSELKDLGRAIDAERSPWELIAGLEQLHPELDDVIGEYERLNDRALAAAEAAGLVTPARDYGLAFRTLPEWAREAAGSLYFLFYRSPPAGRPGEGSSYWVFPPGEDAAAYLRGQSTATIKITHVVHHGSVGHHTQNARARRSPVRLGQLAGTDCASGIAFLSGGSTVEGWACYAQDLMLEADSFYTPLERLQLKAHELRNAATCLADIRMHSGAWSLEDVRRFYAEEAGFSSTRTWSETTRNSMFPGSRLMYWLGTREIKQARPSGPARDYHDAIIAYGSVPVALAVRETQEVTAL